MRTTSPACGWTQSPGLLVSPKGGFRWFRGFPKWISVENQPWNSVERNLWWFSPTWIFLYDFFFNHSLAVVSYMTMLDDWRKTTMSMWTAGQWLLWSNAYISAVNMLQKIQIHAPVNQPWGPWLIQAFQMLRRCVGNVLGVWKLVKLMAEIPTSWG